MDERLLELAKDKKLSYSDVMGFCQRNLIDIDLTTIMEVSCLSRGLDYDRVAYLYGVLCRNDDFGGYITRADSRVQREAAKKRQLSQGLPADLQLVANGRR